MCEDVRVHKYELTNPEKGKQNILGFSAEGTWRKKRIDINRTPTWQLHRYQLTDGNWWCYSLLSCPDMSWYSVTLIDTRQHTRQCCLSDPHLKRSVNASWFCCCDMESRASSTSPRMSQLGSRIVPKTSNASESRFCATNLEWWCSKREWLQFENYFDQKHSHTIQL